MPMALANSTILSNTAGSVSTVPMTSAMLDFHSSLAKCSARNLVGRPVKPFKSLGGSVEELVAKIDFSGATRPNFVYVSRLMSRTSGMASMTRSASPTASARSEDRRMRAWAAATVSPSATAFADAGAKAARIVPHGPPDRQRPDLDRNLLLQRRPLLRRHRGLRQLQRHRRPDQGRRARGRRVAPREPASQPQTRSGAETAEGRSPGHAFYRQ